MNKGEPLLPSVAAERISRCSKCSKAIGKDKTRVLLPEKSYRVLCFKCFTGAGNSTKVHNVIYPECRIEWHDMYDHDNFTVSKAGGERFLSAPPVEAVITASELMAIKFPEPELAFDIVRLGLCTGQCLVASYESDCECVCGGKYHAALADAVVRSADVGEA